jgi:hydrogenase maturation protease
MTDEGVGVRLVRELSVRGARFPQVEFADLGASGLGVLHAMAGRRKAVFVDCAFMGERPGTLRRFRPESVRSTKARLTVTAHGADLIETIELSRRLGECPEEIVIFGIQPESVAPGEELSPVLRRRMQDYADAVIEELGAAAYRRTDRPEAPESGRRPADGR